MMYVAKYASPLGAISLASDGEVLTGLWFDGQKYDRYGLGNEVEERDDLPVFADAKRWLDIYFSGKDPGFRPALAVPESEFARIVSAIMLQIPYGQTTTYGEIARKVAKRLGRESMSSQAVGYAVGHNPISLIVPCHRVVGSSGSLTGYAGGLERKVALLEGEGINLKDRRLFIPAKGTAL
ncbi:MAG: methylated-DNA--[protein]-cysteine S-methyltransferase [Sphaerochaetaceae bacterium]|nr:methylated-DNA--[protein]-cysteine S-methyltransferase [Spirochaetales bacterium]MDY5499933.1 methylated-DNA--[protein]-cysteine S-methyltransferase [Sphaerochaetaceae bacterium]